ncbi:WD40 repeat domain-containing protein [Maridesulfovibrio sp.]|uniref:WD40 repeat domain-containing protein n=1 Tax=Maridesulfovibrio sp. TaxID=2795000 RepID=UPI002A18B716|nr:WD40 repeat domain-containing protein [Maridesulfovibrio sp.]
MISRKFKVGLTGLALLFVTAGMPAQGNAASKERVGQSYIEVPSQLRKGTTKSLKSYVSKLLSKKYVSAKKLYEPPFEGLEDKLYISVKREKAMPIIAGGVSSYAGNEEGLAAALYDGTVRIWSKHKCSKVRLPGGGGAMQTGYGSGSPTLAATGRDGRQIYVFNLDECSRIPGEIPVEHGPVKMMALSRTGEWLGIIDSFNTLLCGPVSGPLQEISILEGTPLYLGYTPGQGVLVAVEASGRIVKQGMKTQTRLDSDEVPGGPFVDARMAGYVVCLTRDNGSEVYWDLSKRATVKKSEALQQEPAWIYKRDGGLVYSTGVDRWKITEHLGMPMFIVSYSATEKLLRVRDLDRETRYYSVLDGKEISGTDAEDWKVISPSKGVYNVGKKQFRLYDMVCQKGTMRLYGRHLEDKGFYLWWENVGATAYLNPHPMELPVRESILDDSPAMWVPLIQGEVR